MSVNKVLTKAKFSVFEDTATSASHHVKPRWLNVILLAIQIIRELDVPFEASELPNDLHELLFNPAEELWLYYVWTMVWLQFSKWIVFDSVLLAKPRRRIRESDIFSLRLSGGPSLLSSDKSSISFSSWLLVTIKRKRMKGEKWIRNEWRQMNVSMGMKGERRLAVKRRWEWSMANKIVSSGRRWQTLTFNQFSTNFDHHLEGGLSRTTC